MVNGEELISTTEHVTLYVRCRLERYRYNRVQLYLKRRALTYSLGGHYVF
jgi:hypothetical protein